MSSKRVTATQAAQKLQKALDKPSVRAMLTQDESDWARLLMERFYAIGNAHSEPPEVPAA